VGPSHELDAPPWLRVESTIMATAQGVREAYDARLAPSGLTLSLASLLAYIAEFGPVSQTRAAEHLGQGRAATGAQVDRLQELGLIERRPDVDDRRVWMVAVTRVGAVKAAEVAAVDAVLRSELRAGISRAERQQLAAVLVRLQHNIAAATGAESRQVADKHTTSDKPTNNDKPTNHDKQRERSWRTQ
jgi:MarR family transcriptional regulator, transcriptional regulator for hemolysin